MAWPWDDDEARDDSNNNALDQLIQAYGRGDIDLSLRRPGVGTVASGWNAVAPVPQSGFGGSSAQPTTLGEQALAEYRSGLGASASTPVSFAGGAQALPTPLPLPLPPVVFPGTPENDHFVKALNDIWNGFANPKKPQSSVGAQSENPHDDECEEQLDKDMIQCKIAGAVKGSRAYKICEGTANNRYSECLIGGIPSIKTPLYW